MTTNYKKTPLKFMVISAIAAIMVVGAVAPSIIPAFASHDEPQTGEISKEVECPDAELYTLLECTVWITYEGDDALIVETIPAGMDVTEESKLDLEASGCTVEASNKNGKANSNTKAKHGHGSTKITCLVESGDEIHFVIESNLNPSGKQRPTSCGEDNDFEVNGGVSAYAVDEEGELILVQLHNDAGEPVDDEGNVVDPGSFLVPILLDSTEPVFVPVLCPVE